jgi:ribosome-associated toxin RatA of RatAB toxin-antitoxin module
MTNRQAAIRSGGGALLRQLLLVCAGLVASLAAFGVVLAQDAEPLGDVQVRVTLDSNEQAGTASATVRIHASPETVWSLVTNCKDALAIVPGLVACDVVDQAPDGSWQKIRHVLDYSWYVKKLTYELMMRMERPTRVSVERVSGDLKTMKVTWDLQKIGDYTLVSYVVELNPGFWVPHWLVRLALKRDLPKMLRTLRTRAESAAQNQ